MTKKKQRGTTRRVKSNRKAPGVTGIIKARRRGVLGEARSNLKRGGNEKVIGGGHKGSSTENVGGGGTPCYEGDSRKAVAPDIQQGTK